MRRRSDGGFTFSLELLLIAIAIGAFLSAGYLVARRIYYSGYNAGQHQLVEKDKKAQAGRKAKAQETNRKGIKRLDKIQRSPQPRSKEEADEQLKDLSEIGT